MCPPKVSKTAPAAMTTPTMQAADELLLSTDGLQDNAIGRQALQTSGRRAPVGNTSSAAKAASAGAASGGAAAGSTLPPTDAGSALGFTDAAGSPSNGRQAGSRQPFYQVP